MSGQSESATDLPLSPEEILEDYRLAYRSRQASLIGRREVMSGKAKFGIFGDGKEIAQIALAKVIQKGDFRSGYYRDQTFMFASGETTIQSFFAQLYAHADLEADPATAGRSMNAHFATRSLNCDGQWKDLMAQFNSAADLSPTAAQMPRLVGLAYASRLYRELEELKAFPQFSHNGDEIAFGMVGNASCAEGLFWEAINAIGVLHAPALISIWDDGYGISVPNQYQITKQDLSALLQGFQRQPGSKDGFDVYSVKGWDYTALVATYKIAADIVRREHVPAIVHVNELTQPQGHSTSGSHERYKSPERLKWEEEFDCLTKMRAWILEQEIVSEEELKEIEEEDRIAVEDIRKAAWDAYLTPILKERQEVSEMMDAIAGGSQHAAQVQEIKTRLLSNPMPLRRDLHSAIEEVLLVVRDEATQARQPLIVWKRAQASRQQERYDSCLYGGAALSIPEIKAVYTPKAQQVYGFEILNACFDAALKRDPRLIAFGEDVGHLGDVNQGFRGLQAKYGELRVSDTGIREATIVGQAIGAAMRGLHPIVEIQYLDYLLYALQTLSDDLATLYWRTRGGQKAAVIVRTRGHRLEGIWHSGSLMSGIMNLLRGIYVLVPRNMTQAAGFYNTLLRAEEPGLIVEVLNGYRLRETMPDNVGEFTVPLGVPQVLRTGEDITLVTYGACCRIVMNAAEMLSQTGIQAEVIDVQSLLPFDLRGIILNSLKKTGRIMFIDEDVPGGTTAYMLQQVIENQGGYYWLDSPPQTLPGKEHRPAYGSDGDYWSKPNAEQVFETAYKIMHEVEPARFPMFF
jgi:pyruvate/2-oxoglutarate/acetoin dehydrogenase E1 component/TPP-dependent pyruvate/acetoin dehydrogenase alpha subunit